MLAAAALAALAVGAWVARSTLFAPSMTGRSAETLFAVTLPDADGGEQPLAQWKGKVLVVNFWATWCAPCREEMPMFVRVQRDDGPRGLQFVGIAVDQVDKVRQFAGEIGLNY
ncbi:partial Thiol:disulfide interchange protein TlpA, partial [Burkholderiales bacterium]